MSGFTQEELIERAVGFLKKEEYSDADYLLVPSIERGWKNRRSVVFNFVEICEALGLDDQGSINHLKKFIDFKTTMKSTMDQSGKLYIVGRAHKADIENYIDEYINNFIYCQTCQSANTNLEKVGRNTFVCCEKCGCRHAIAGYSDFSKLK